MPSYNGSEIQYGSSVGFEIACGKEWMGTTDDLVFPVPEL